MALIIFPKTGELIYMTTIRKKKRRKEEKRNLSKNSDMTQKHITAVKHWSPPSFYCSALPDLRLVLFPEMSVSQPFPKGFGDE